MGEIIVCDSCDDRMYERTSPQMILFSHSAKQKLRERVTITKRVWSFRVEEIKLYLCDKYLSGLSKITAKLEEKK